MQQEAAIRNQQQLVGARVRKAWWYWRYSPWLHPPSGQGLAAVHSSAHERGDRPGTPPRCAARAGGPACTSKVSTRAVRTSVASRRLCKSAGSTPDHWLCSDASIEGQAGGADLQGTRQDGRTEASNKRPGSLHAAQHGGAVRRFGPPQRARACGAACVRASPATASCRTWPGAVYDSTQLRPRRAGLSVGTTGAERGKKPCRCGLTGHGRSAGQSQTGEHGRCTRATDAQ